MYTMALDVVEYRCMVITLTDQYLAAVRQLDKLSQFKYNNFKYITQPTPKNSQKPPNLPHRRTRSKSSALIGPINHKVRAQHGSIRHAMTTAPIPAWLRLE